MFCTLTALAGTHPQLALCRDRAKQNKRKKLNLKCIRAFQHTCQIQEQPIETVADFHYLRRILTSHDNDWAAARWNLKKAKQWWATISRVLAHESASPRISALFYKANTIQTVLLYGSETWVINNEILKLSTSFHHSIATNRLIPMSNT
jgi:hypothetical protein